MKLPQNYLDIIDVWREENPQIALKAEATIGYLLKDLIDSENEGEYHSSALTYTGSPFEPAFSFSSLDIRYTIAPAPKCLVKSRRLNHSLSLLDGLDVNRVDSNLLKRLRSIQSKGELTYGAQIGVRHSLGKDIYKLYVELPEEAKEDSEELAQSVLGGQAILQHKDRNAFPTLFGINLQTNEMEVYYRVENLHPQEIRTVLARSNSADRFADVLAFLNETQDMPIKHYLPGNTWGFSYSMNSKKKITCSIYTFAKTLFGPDGWVRDKVLEMGKRRSWNIEGYSKISKALKGNRDFLHHGIFGIVIPPNRPAAAWIGIAPIESKYV